MTRIGLSWTFFLLGDLVSRPMVRWQHHLSWLYPLYAGLMGWSIELQGESDKGPWNKVIDPRHDEIEFLVLIRDKVDILITQVAVNDPLIEISAMLTSRIAELEKAIWS